MSCTRWTTPHIQLMPLRCHIPKGCIPYVTYGTHSQHRTKLRNALQHSITGVHNRAHHSIIEKDTGQHSWSVLHRSSTAQHTNVPMARGSYSIEAYIILSHSLAAHNLGSTDGTTPHHTTPHQSMAQHDMLTVSPSVLALPVMSASKSSHSSLEGTLSPTTLGMLASTALVSWIAPPAPLLPALLIDSYSFTMESMSLASCTTQQGAG
jgi:hypothetical protein